ncbi:MAG: ATP synthase subunit I [Clostridium sp.]|nr:MAG: ATP synthase subunit I [Clostridium sp.]
MDEMSKFGIIVVPITWTVGAIVAIILGIWGPDRWWLSYLLGLMTALLNFGLMMKSNRRLAEKTKNQEEIKPKRIALTGYFVRIIVFVAIFTAVCYSQFKN